MLVKHCFQQIRLEPNNIRVAGKQERRVVPVDNKDFRYLRFRAIGCMEVSGHNGNFDGFSYGEFEDEDPGFGYRSFIGKKAHVEHQSHLGLAGAIGDLPDAYLNKFNYPEDIKEKKWAAIRSNNFNKKRAEILSMPNQKLGDIEVLMRIDTQLVKSSQVEKKTRQLLDRIVRMIDTGQVITCSMGANVAESRCTACFNLARFSSDYCQCLKHKKGSLMVVTANQIRDAIDKEHMRPEWLKHLVASKYDVDEVLNGQSNKGIATRVAEMNHKVSFFELSVVARPAFADAVMLEKLASKTGSDREEYLKSLRAEIGDDNILDLFSLMREEGVISPMCEVR